MRSIYKNKGILCGVLGMLLTIASVQAGSAAADPGQGAKNRYRIQKPSSQPDIILKKNNPGYNAPVRQRGRTNNPNGPNGPKGPKGPNGPNGPNGSNGPNGNNSR
jgi:hypothetical protein